MSPATEAAPSGWRIWIDRGGTFTDLVARAPDGQLQTAKLLSENPSAYADAALEGIGRLLGVPSGAAIPDGAIEMVRMGTTVATNALLQRRGARTLLVVDRGFADLLTIGDQSRPALFALDIERPAPLAARVVEIDGRLAPDGSELLPLDEEAARDAFSTALDDGFTACAIARLHGWAHPAHETRLAELARQAGFAQVSASHEVDPRPRLVPRARTAVLDAYLGPVLRHHVDRLHAALPGVRLLFMQSHGGLVEASRFRARDAILSGPAGGVVGATRTARAAGFERIVAFDMGGTSTDVSIQDGPAERMEEAVVAGIALRAPMLAIETVAAGGGSIIRFDGERLRVGPESGGADPGPAAYRRGGQPTVTDANILLGRVRPERFPALFGPASDQPLDVEAVAAAFQRLSDECGRAGVALSPMALAEGALSLAVQQMADAIRRIGLQRGRDLDGFTLACFGGAGGQHACLVADELGLDRVFIHRHASLLSAYGMGLADQSVLRTRSVEQPLPTALDGIVADLEAEARAALIRDGAEPDRIATTTRVLLRYAGSETALPVPLGPEPEMRAGFEAAHRRRFGFQRAGRPLLVQAIELEAALPGDALDAPAPVRVRPADPMAPALVPVWDGRAMRPTPLHDRAALRSGQPLAGPVLIAAADSITVVEAGWQADIDPEGGLVLERVTARRAEQPEAAGSVADPVRLALFNAIFMGVAEEMGTVLQNTALSVNIRERLDFSCAVFDAQGQLVANAPHVPVHLGAMGESVRHVLRVRGASLAPGDSIALNDPYAGGTHLPDVTLVSPVFDTAGTLRFLVGSRGHHADIGGITPGSVPPFSTCLAQEGVVLDNVLAVRGGVLLEAEIRALLTGAAHPARDPDTNIADLAAQVAANEAGIRALRRVALRYGWDALCVQAGRVMDNAERAVRRLLRRLPEGKRTLRLDDGAALRIAVSIDRGACRARIDFTGTDPQRPGNFNAPTAVVRAAILYALRCLVDDDIPLNDGCLRPIGIVVPEGSFLSPRPGVAVVSGNTELSQAVANALLGAVGACASAQGTMNNLTFGDERLQYYETIGGGTGAGPGFAGASGVQSHMTNTRMTDPEVLEARLPVRVERFALRAGSGGDGARRGGDGLVRALRFLSPMRLMLVSSRRSVAPFGLRGGGDGAVGRQWIERADGGIERLRGVDQAEIRPGDLFVIETPGGGGHGTPGDIS